MISVLLLVIAGVTEPTDTLASASIAIAAGSLLAGLPPKRGQIAVQT